MQTLQIELIRNSVERIYRDKVEFSAFFYERLFGMAPSIRDLFNNDDAKQREMLFAVMTMVTKRLDDMDNLRPALEALGRAHAHIDAFESLLPVFGKAFYDTLVFFHGEECEAGLEAAWKAFFDDVGGIMCDARHGRRPDAPLFHRTPGAAKHLTT